MDISPVVDDEEQHSESPPPIEIPVIMVNVTDNSNVKTLGAARPNPAKIILFPRKADFLESWAKIETVVQLVMSAQPCSAKRWDDCFL